MLTDSASSRLSFGSDSIITFPCFNWWWNCSVTNYSGSDDRCLRDTDLAGIYVRIE